MTQPKTTAENTPAKKNISEIKDVKSDPKNLTFEFSREELKVMGNLLDIAAKGAGLYAAQPVSHFMKKFGMQVKPLEGN